MNETFEILDARGLPCPAPVITVKKALERGLYGVFGVLVDTDAAKENVRRFATQAGCTLLSVEKSDSLPADIPTGTGSRGSSSGWLLRLCTSSRQPEEPPVRNQIPEAQSNPASSGKAAPIPVATQVEKGSDAGNAPTTSTDRLTIFVASDSLGTGSEELGSRLVQGLLYAFSEREPAPAWLILVNAGVRLAIEGSSALPSLRSLESKGCPVLSCGTCLEYYGLTARLAAGRSCAMDEVVEILGSTRVLRI